MPQKKAKCPHCGTENVYNEPSWDEALKERLPENVAKASVVTLLSVMAPPVGLLVGGLLYADNVKRYLDGVSLTCAACSRTFKVTPP